MATDLIHLAQCLAGEFTNKPQALAEPIWFVQLKLWIRPVPQLSSTEHVTFFLEQASMAYDQPPYRQRLLQLASQQGNLTATYSALKDPKSWQGAAQNPDRLGTLTDQDLMALTGSTLSVVHPENSHGETFIARHFPGERCQFQVDGQAREVELGFDAISGTGTAQSPDQFYMYDRGYDATQDKYTWGALHGPFKLQKQKDFSTEIISA
ncbi:chromophore lyase CpcT/CpeT [Leptolyngbya sp. PCC 6406]|uniref:chromophore lyase CpcT/CpeT n=1 Tax=Leptolyngbya sp. PCC 6406 TaxID=1173264 RepID=UPI0002AC4BB7|nr:chromophore lyase CpcT/CpeT [Leptolyngbya sp. PCC 6406]